MKIIIGLVLLLISTQLAAQNTLPQTSAPDATCRGRFPNPATDICWRCMLPVTIGAMPLANVGNQRDLPNPASPICTCPGFPLPKIGVSLGFWEPAKVIEIPRRPWCFPLLGGLSINGPKAPAHGRFQLSAGVETASYQAHEYTFPLLAALGIANDNPCLEQSTIDLGYITELDPTWSDPALATLFSPEAILFANPGAIAACAADCVAATANLPIQSLFWCAGCQGSSYPQQGFIAHHNGGIDSSLLLTQRLLSKVHKLGLAKRTHDTAVAMCQPATQFVIDRRAYKTQLIFPRPNTTQIDGKCCQPLGQSTISYRAGKEFPGDGEDFAYLVFRKRNCCATVN